MNKYIVGTVVILLAAAGSVFLYTHTKGEEESLTPEYAKTTVIINNTAFVSDIADIEALRTLGLSGRETLGKNEAMLFVFDDEAPRSFWMKDMYFPLDIVWINSEKRIVDISKDLQPESYPETFSPSSPAQYVLEIRAGLSDEKGFKEGDRVEFSL